MVIKKDNIMKYMNFSILFLLLLIHYSTQEEPVFNSYLDCINYKYTEERIGESVIFRDLKFYFDTIYISDQLHNANHDDYKEPLFQAIYEAGEILESFLEMYVGWNPVLTSDEKAIKDYVPNWNRDLLKYDISDEEIFLSKGYTIMVIFRLGQDMGDRIAKSRILYDDICGNPEIGLITLNPNKNYKAMSSEYLKTIMLQQLTLLLAFKEQLLDNSLSFNYLDEIEEDDDGDDDDDDDDDDNEVHYKLSSPLVVEFAKKYFGCPTLQDVEIILIKDEDEVYNGDFHWSPRYFLGEYMADINYSEELVISEFTLALFKDLGYLRVKNKYTGGLMRFGKNQGCEFRNQKCKNNLKNFKNDFYYPTDAQMNVNFEEPSCSSGRLSKTIHKLIQDNAITGDYIYYSSQLGGLKSTEYCAVSMSSSDIIYAGSCSQETNTPNTDIGESFSSHSFCALSSLIINNAHNTSPPSVRAVCFEMHCSETSLSIKYGDYYFVCPREGGKIAGDEIGFIGYLLCPDYNLICTGTVPCNNLFNCFKQSSSEKESSFNYDNYEKDGGTTIIRTTQISSEYISADNSDNGWEEDDENGKCPLNCAICKKKNSNDYQCIKCRSGFGLKGYTNRDDVICVISSDLATGYYQSSNLVYYPCISNCEECDNGNTCLTCSAHYIKNQDNICEERVPNCKSYDGDENCIECNNNYNLVKAKNGDISCKKTVELQEQYYSIDEAGRTYYIKCSDEIDNCYSCSLSTHCHSCMDGYGIIDNNHAICQEITNEYYYDTDLNSYKLCSHKNTGCKKCEKIDNNDINCIECNTPYALIYSQINRCVLQTSIRDDKSIFFNSKTLKYYKCNDYRYHSVKNCLTCHDEEECDSCQNGYELSNSNVLCLSNIEINEKKYYKDANDNNYYPCSKLIKGCESCENAEKCLECNIAFDLDENDKCIPTALAMTRYYLNTETGRYVSCSKIENCEECSSSEICTRCNSGYELNNNSCQKIEQKNDGNDKYKAIAIAGLVLGCVGIVGTICSILLIFFKKLLCKKSSSKASDATESVNPNNEQNDNDKNDVDIHSRRNLHNVKKDNSE